MGKAFHVVKQINFKVVKLVQSTFVRVSSFAHFKLYFTESQKQDLGKWGRNISLVAILTPPKDWLLVSWGEEYGGESEKPKKSCKKPSE